MESPAPVASMSQDVEVPSFGSVGNFSVTTVAALTYSAGVVLVSTAASPAAAQRRLLFYIYTFGVSSYHR